MIINMSTYTHGQRSFPILSNAMTWHDIGTIVTELLFFFFCYKWLYEFKKRNIEVNPIWTNVIKYISQLEQIIKLITSIPHKCEQRGLLVGVENRHSGNELRHVRRWIKRKTRLIWFSRMMRVELMLIVIGESVLRLLWPFVVLIEARGEEKRFVSN